MPKQPVSFSAPATDALFVPGLDPGLHLLSRPDSFWAPVPGGTTSSLMLSEREDIQTRWDREQRRIAKQRRFDTIIELNTQAVVIEDARFERTFAAVGGRWFLNGTAGGRMMTKYTRNFKDAHPEADFRENLAAHYARARDHATPIPVWDGAVKGLDFALDARHLHNYYHFIKETFCNLCLLDKIADFDGQVHIHSPAHEASGFVLRFLDALFPELAGRVHFSRTPHHHQRVLTAFTPDYYLFQAPPGVSPPLDPLMTPRTIWTPQLPDQHTLRTLALNAYARPLRLLRERALRAIAGRDFSYLPRRFWVGRAVVGDRDRRVGNQDAVLAGLQAHGFVVVYFEKLDPLEQIALMAGAEVMVSFHGAGFTNLLYANPAAHVIELGTLQSGLLRWADFIALAHVAGCTYTYAVADYAHAAEGEDMPRLRGGHLHELAISDAGVDRLMAHIDGI